IGIVIVNVMSFLRDTKAYGNVSSRGDLTAQNDRISEEIKAGGERAEKSFEEVDKKFEKLDSGITTLLVGDMEKKKDLEFLSKDQGRMLSSVEALVTDYTKLQMQVSELRRENSELMSRNEQLRDEIQELRRETQKQLGCEMEM
uniref:cell division protein ZapB n=1 Tax=Prevotella heparinolytica TaxID=28113 RepID=UPI0035A17FEE